MSEKEDKNETERLLLEACPDFGVLEEVEEYLINETDSYHDNNGEINNEGKIINKGEIIKGIFFHGHSCEQYTVNFRRGLFKIMFEPNVNLENISISFCEDSDNKILFQYKYENSIYVIAQSNIRHIINSEEEPELEFGIDLNVGSTQNSIMGVAF